MENEFVLISGSQDCSVILACGMLYNNNGNYTFDGYKNYYIEEIAQRTISGGLLTLNVIPILGKKVTITGVYVQQGDDVKIPYNTRSNSGRGSGGHWFSCNILEELLNNQYIEINEFHQQKTNNDSWETNMIGNSEIISLQLLIVGYVE